MIREPGYYWVKSKPPDSAWGISWTDGDVWLLFGYANLILDSNFEEIGRKVADKGDNPNGHTIN